MYHVSSDWANREDEFAHECAATQNSEKSVGTAHQQNICKAKHDSGFISTLNLLLELDLNGFAPVVSVFVCKITGLCLLARWLN